MYETAQSRRGRGAQSNASGRYELLQRCDIHDGWQAVSELPADARTQWRMDNARTVITRNQSPDIHFEQSINPYRGCEHGCIYCFARPSHTWLGHSAGLDFERLLYAKCDVAKLLREELAKPGYQCKPIAVGVNTDAWQPLERKLKLTRQILQVFAECRHPVYLITKSSLIERDLDLLTELAGKRLVSVSITLTTLDGELARRLEPRATAPHRRLRTLNTLAEAGIPVRVSISPIIPVLNEAEIDTLVQSAADAGAEAATALMLRLPHELADLFTEWLQEHYPLRANRVLKAIRSMRGNKLNDSEFGTRFLGKGPRAEIIQQRFQQACRKAGISSSREILNLDTTLFRPPMQGGQLALF